MLTMKKTNRPRKTPSPSDGFLFLMCVFTVRLEIISCKIANAILQTFPKSARAAREGGVGGGMPAPPSIFW